MAATALSHADSLSIDGLHLLAIQSYTEAICLTDDRSTHNHNDDDNHHQDRLTLRFLAFSHRSAAYLTTKQYNAGYRDAVEAIGLIDVNRYDFSSENDGKKLRYDQVSLAHHRAASCSVALGDDTKARAHWEEGITLAVMGENAELVKMYQNCLAVGGGTAKDGGRDEVMSGENEVREDTDKMDEEEQPIVEVVEKPASKPRKAEAKSSAPAKPAAPIPAATATQTPKYAYYQDSTWMKIQISEPNLTPETCTVSITPTSLAVTVLKNGTSYNIIHGDLSESVIPERCRTLYKEQKVLIKLKKVEDGEWHSLLDDKKKNIPPNPAPIEKKSEATTTDTKTSMPRPYASTKDWNAIDRSLKQQEEAEKPEGEEALNTLFKQIYANANEDTRRAMVKSMQTSGGTVLSTNWEEVKEADYEKERVAPKGMEWKNYEGDRLKMKEDD